MPRRLITEVLCATALLAAFLCAPASAAGATSDPLHSLAWQFDGDGPMGIDTAWAQTTGVPVIVAVLDTGVDASHPDLAGRLWSNTGEIPGNRVDDDHDGYVDDVNGWNFVARNASPDDDNGHGTHVAGIIAADADNGIGAAGVDPNVSVMNVKVLDSRAGGDAATVARGLRFAVAHGARIVNLSLATPMPNRALRDALSVAQNAGVLVIDAAGNWGENLSTEPEYPASYRAPNAISVAATDRTGALDPTSNYGTSVDLAAPGADIVSTARGGGYELRTGTSMATGIVSGVAALVAAQHPDWRWPQLRAAVLRSARRTALAVSGGAAVDAGAAVAWTVPAGFSTRLTTPRIAHVARRKTRA